MTTIYLIRHAEADGNLYRRAHGWYDSVITDRGYRQIAALAKRFASTRFDAVYSSDRRRTMTTALSVYKTHGLPLVTTPRVREIGIGVWEDHPWAELERTDGEQLERFNTDAAHWHVAGGEHLPDVRERMIGALREIAEAHPNGTAAVFSHGMAIRLTVGTLQGLSLHEIDGTGHAENTAVSCLEYEDGAFRVAYRDDASHLENGLQTLKRQAWLKNARGFEGGIYYVPSGAEGHFDVCRAGETVGAVSVDKCENGLATIGEFWLENDVQGLGFGQQLVGQALSYARAHGCERLSTGRIAKGNALGLRRAREWGFTQTGEGADWLEFQKNFEYDEESCWKKLQEVIEKEKSKGRRRKDELSVLRRHAGKGDASQPRGRVFSAGRRKAPGVVHAREHGKGRRGRAGVEPGSDAAGMAGGILLPPVPQAHCSLSGGRIKREKPPPCRRRELFVCRGSHAPHGFLFALRTKRPPARAWRRW